MQLTGIDDFSGGLEDITDRVPGVEGVDRGDLYPDSWIQSHTGYDALQEFVDAGFDDQYDAFEEIPDDEWDAWVDSETQFSDWEAMQTAARQAWLQRQLGL